MPSLADMQTVNRDLIRKGLEGSVFIKRRVAGDPEIETLVGPSGLLALPAGYLDVGFITKDQGVEWSRDIGTSDVMSHGQSQPTRRDITSDVTGLQFTAQESKAVTLGLHEGLDLSAVKRDANGNVTFDKPNRSASIYYRAFVLYKDGDGVDAVYFAKWLPNCQVSDRGNQSWNEDSEVQYQITLTAFVDPVVGSSIRHLWAGPVATVEAMGFTAGP